MFNNKKLILNFNRNNSYLNAHPVTIPINYQTQHLQQQQPILYTNSSSNNNRAKTNSHNHSQQQPQRLLLKSKDNLNNNGRGSNKQNVLMPIEDYASYEITV